MKQNLTYFKGMILGSKYQLIPVGKLANLLQSIHNPLVSFKKTH